MLSRHWGIGSFRAASIPKRSGFGARCRRIDVIGFRFGIRSGDFGTSRLQALAAVCGILATFVLRRMASRSAGLHRAWLWLYFFLRRRARIFGCVTNGPGGASSRRSITTLFSSLAPHRSFASSAYAIFRAGSAPRCCKRTHMDLDSAGAGSLDAGPRRAFALIARSKNVTEREMLLLCIQF